ncbi:hypothetical protein A9Z42_0078170 [Trichoderma parareesei]|uniref:F-box domain-containing protein n=1 Tax=Trichoderma parareesei TaxID=858221 RepID=A0A2H2ZMU7_TRIPA|nr:hypothetical protein A9Z42_0078170 [Trichoderma parareesei]
MPFIGSALSIDRLLGLHLFDSLSGLSVAGQSPGHKLPPATAPVSAVSARRTATNRPATAAALRPLRSTSRNLSPSSASSSASSSRTASASPSLLALSSAFSLLGIGLQSAEPSPPRPEAASRPPCPIASWPMAQLPVEIFELITRYLTRAEIQTLRLVCREFEAKVSAQYFRNVVVPFRSELYTSLDHDENTVIASRLFSNGMRIFESFGPHILRFALSLELDEFTLAYPPVKPAQEAVPAFWGIYRWPHATYHRYRDLEGLEQTADETDSMKKALRCLTKVTNLGLCCDAGLGFLVGPDQAVRKMNNPDPVFNTSYFRQEGRSDRGDAVTVSDFNGMPRDLCSATAQHDNFKRRILEKMIADAGFAGFYIHEAIDLLLETEGVTLSNIDFDEREVLVEEQQPLPPLAAQDRRASRRRWLNQLQAAPQQEHVVQPQEPNFHEVDLPEADIQEADIQEADIQAPDMEVQDQDELGQPHHAFVFNLNPNAFELFQDPLDPAPAPAAAPPPPPPAPAPASAPAVIMAQSSPHRQRRAENQSSRDAASESNSRQPLIPTNLTRAQKELLLELEWAHRAMIQSYVISIIDNARDGCFSNLTNITIAKIPSAHVHILCRKELWESIPRVKNVSLAVIADWRRISKTSPGVVADTHVSPLDAVRKVYKLLHCYIGQQQNIETLHFEWICGGEFARGPYQRNQYILPAPFVDSPELMSSVDGAKDTDRLLDLPYVRDFSLKNCWVSPHVLMQTIRNMALHSLERLEFESVSLSGPPVFAPQPVNVAQVAEDAGLPLPPIFPGGAAPMIAGPVGEPAAAMFPQPAPAPPASSDEQQSDRLVLPEPFSWAGFCEHFSPGIKMRMLPRFRDPAVDGTVKPEDLTLPLEKDLAPFLPYADQLAADESQYNLSSITFKSCGYVFIDVRNLDFRALLPPEGPAAHAFINSLRHDIFHSMQYCKDKLLGRILPYILPSEWKTLETVFLMERGWANLYSTQVSDDAIADGFEYPGMGRFSGTVEKLDDAQDIEMLG